MAEIAFRNVSKRYGNTLAVDNVSFTVKDNEFFCFFGPPLSGKTTILRLILGLETPDDGQIMIAGRPVTGVSPAQRNVAMVFQNLALFPHMSARDNVCFPLVERGIDRAVIKKRLGEVSAKLYIGHILHKAPAQLSGGERQRVAIARALARDPEAYLMDDPISALDARLRESTRVELKRIQREMGKTLIYVTHDQEEAMSVADRMAILEHGRIRQTGTPADLYDMPENLHVALQLGSPAMNIVAVSEGALLGLGMPALPGAVNVGVRPEHVKLGDKGAAHAIVTEVEPLGGYTVVTLTAGPRRLRAMARGQLVLKPGVNIGFSCAERHIHWFDAAGNVLPRDNAPRDAAA